MDKYTRFLYLFVIPLQLIFLPKQVFPQNADTLFYDTFEDMSNWTPVGPQGFTSWEMSNTNYAGGNTSPEIRFNWVFPFIGESYLLAAPVFNGMQGHNMELKFNYYEDWWSNIVYVGVAVTGDGGNTYNSIWELQASGNSGPELITVNFTGMDYMQIALYYLGDSNDIDFWYVDDLTLIDLDAVPVELISFTAEVLNGDVVLNWVTATETNNNGFEIERLQDSKISGLRDWIKIGFIDGNGTTTRTGYYSFTDNNVKTGTYSYRLKQIDYNGNSEYSNVVEVDIINPVEFSLEQNYPNPFNPTTKINFNLPVDSKVNLYVYDVLGQKVKTLVNGNLQGGNNEITFDASGLNSGVYFYKIEAVGTKGHKYSSVKKMILTK